MPEKNETIEIKAVRVRRNWNNSVVNVPNEVKEELKIDNDDEIEYVKVENDNDESMVVIRRSKNNNDNELIEEPTQNFENPMMNQ